MPATTRAYSRRPARRTQAERRAATRDRLLDATIDCIAELGYAATSTTEIVRRAGVSRGAQVHHYPTKAVLVTAALDRLFERRLDEFETGFAALPEQERRPDVAIDVLWSMFQGRTFDAWLELTVAGRTDPDLRASLIEVNERFDNGVEETFRRVFPDAGADAVPIVWFTFTVLTGTAVTALSCGERRPTAEPVEVLKSLAAMFLPDAWRHSS